MADRLVILLPKMIILSQMDRACFTVLATLQDRGLCTWLPAQVAVEHLLHSLGPMKTSREEDGCPEWPGVYARGTLRLRQVWRHRALCCPHRGQSHCGDRSAVTGKRRTHTT